MRVSSLSLLLVCLLSLTIGTEQAVAQYASPRLPRGEEPHFTGQARAHHSEQSERIDTIYIAPLERAEIARALDAERGIKGTEQGEHVGGYLVGQAVDTRIDPRERGTWSTDATGGYLWRCTLRSEGARSLALTLSDYRMPEGGALFVYGRDGKRRGAFTHDNNSASGILALAPIDGDVVTLEYELPHGMSPSGASPFVISRVGRGFRNWTLERIEQIGANEAEPFYNRLRTTLGTLSCAPNIVAFPERRRESRSVLCFLAASPEGGMAIASGTLINNARMDGTAYVLTSAHCINGLFRYENDQTAINRIVSSLVFFFGFESPSPSVNIRGAEELSLSGAELVAYEPDADMALLKITGLPPSGQIPTHYNPYFAGWSVEETHPAPYFGIHHPVGSTKRYSEVQDEFLTIRDYNLRVADGMIKSFEGKHYRGIRWATGTTDQGSSGSPLFDRQGRIIAALTGGSSSCADPTSGDSYWALNRVWRGTTARASLAPHLDPDNVGMTSLPGYDPQRSLPVQRLSAYYAETDVPTLAPRTAVQGVQGVGQSLRLSHSARPLGGFIVFAGERSLQTAFPRLVLELHSLEGGQVGELRWSAELSSAQYRRYDRTTGGFGESRRTVAFDSIELFIPTPEELMLPEGDYLLGLRSADGGDLSLRLLGGSRAQRITSRQLAPSWQLRGGTWTNSTSAPTPWIDLLVEATPLESSLITQEAGQGYLCYFHSGTLYTFNPDKAEAELFIYNLSGELAHRTALPEGETLVELPQLIPYTTYIAYIKGARGKRGIKFVYEP